MSTPPGNLPGFHGPYTPHIHSDEIRANFEALEEYLGIGGWITPAVSTGAEAITLQIRLELGGVVRIRGSFRCKEAFAEGNGMVTVPTAYRPSGSSRLCVMMNASTHVAQPFSAQTNGQWIWLGPGGAPGNEIWFEGSSYVL